MASSTTKTVYQVDTSSTRGWNISLPTLENEYVTAEIDVAPRQIAELVQFVTGQTTTIDIDQYQDQLSAELCTTIDSGSINLAYDPPQMSIQNESTITITLNKEDLDEWKELVLEFLLKMKLIKKMCD